MAASIDVPRITGLGERLSIPLRSDVYGPNEDPFAPLDFRRKEPEYEIGTVKAMLRGAGIPACVMPLNPDRTIAFDHLVNLFSLYRHAGFDGWAWLVHSTGFGLHDTPESFTGAAEMGCAAMDLVDAHYEGTRPRGLRIGGVLGKTDQAVREASTLRELGFHASLVGLKSFAGDAATMSADKLTDTLVDHIRAVGQVSPVILFYLQYDIMGFRIPPQFWHRAAELPCVVGAKAASFRNDETNFLIQAFIETARDDAALLLGDDDRMVSARTMPAWGTREGKRYGRVPEGDLLGHDSLDPYTGARVLKVCRDVYRSGGPIPPSLTDFAGEWDQWNSLAFGAEDSPKYHDCLGRMNAILHEQGLLPSRLCVDPKEETTDEVVRRVLAYRRDILAPIQVEGKSAVNDEEIRQNWSSFAFRPTS